MTYKTDVESAFEKWFEWRCKTTWARTRLPSDSLDPPSGWSMGLRKHLKEGWMGAVFWCRLCQKEHEGACIK